jgi:hypothetical protein
MGVAAGARCGPLGLKREPIVVILLIPYILCHVLPKCQDVA